MRPFQQKAVDVILKEIKAGKQRLLVSLPTGSGKTDIIINTIYQYSKERNYKPHILILHDRAELVNQTVHRLQGAFQNTSIASFQDYSPTKPIIVTTIQLIRHSPKLFLEQPAFDMIVLIDCERMVASQMFQEIYNGYPKAVFIGIDSRTKKSKKFFGNPIYEISFAEVVKEGLLVPFRVIHIDFAPLTTDLHSNSIVNHSSSEIFRELANSIITNVKSTKTLVICPTQSAAQSLTASINFLQKELNYSKAVISSIDREILYSNIEQFRNIELPKILITVDMLTTGADLNNVESIVLIRKIGSHEYLKQIIARGMSPFPGKDVLNVFDYAQNDFVDLFDRPFDTIKQVDESAVVAFIKQSRIQFKSRDALEGVIGVKDIAEEMAAIIDYMPDDQGTMIGVFGKWGRGKTFLVNQIWRLLDSGRYFRVDYHAWKYQDTPASWAYLYENLSTVYFQSNKKTKIGKAIKSFGRKVRLNFKRKGLVPIFKFLFISLAGATVWLLINFYAKKELAGNLIRNVGVSLTVIITLYKLLVHLKKEYSTQAKDLFSKYTQKHSFKEHLGIQAEIQKEILYLAKVWISDEDLGKRKILVFIDDLDRCSEEKIIQVIDSLRIMLEDDAISKRIIVITAIDERILKRAIEYKYVAFMDKRFVPEGKSLEIDTLTKEYFDKLFLIGIKLGELTESEREEFFLEFIKGNIKEEESIQNEENISVTTENISGLNDNYEIFDPLTTEDTEPDTEPVQESYNIDIEEAKLLLKNLSYYEQATPRQICIFYYRYLITKNLLIRQYIKQNRPNVWLSQKNTQLFVELIVKYSLSTDHTLINKHKNEVLKSKSEKHPLFLMENLSFNTNDYADLLKVLEIVMAY